ncbi:MAG: T9SS type A sorting domain-containing protein [Flavobacteriales bacterium]
MKRFVLGAMVAFPMFGHAQHWRGLGVGPKLAAVTRIMADTLEDRLLACGNFNFYINAADTVRCAGIAQWRGTRWDSLAHRIQDTESNTVAQAYWPLRYEGDLYLCGAMYMEDPQFGIHQGYFRLNEQSHRWEAFGCQNPTASSILFATPRETANQPYLYITGLEWPLCDLPQSAVYRWNGASMTLWMPWSQIPNTSENVVNYVFEYRGKVYVCGSFNNPLGPGMRTFLRHNGTSWEEVPGYTGGLVADVSIHRDTLYVAGQFQVPGGNGGHGVAAFDGELWYPLGEGLLFQPSPSLSSGHCLRWFRDELYVGGGFSMAGGIPANGFAKWNRRQWCSLPGFDSESFASGVRVVRSMAVWRDSLFIQGTFSTLEGETIRSVAQWIGGATVTDCSSPVGIAERERNENLAAFPNPTSGELCLVDLPNTASWIEMRDALGRSVLNERSLTPTHDVSAFPNGLYILTVHDKNGNLVGRTKFIKQ